jgi:GT2 family glycosyltransferase
LLVIHDTQRRGSAFGRNIGLKVAKGDLVQFAEDDCHYTASNLRALVERYLDVRRSDQRCAGIVGSFLPAVWGSLAVMIDISTQREALKIRLVSGEGRTDYLATGNAVCSKQIILQCGAFNERYSHMFEDLELSLVLKKNEFTLYNCAQAVAKHLNEPRVEKSSGPLLRRPVYLIARNAILIHRTWCGNPLVYAGKRLSSDLRNSVRNFRRAHYGPSIHSRRIAERKPLFDRMTYLLGVVAGLTSKTGRQTIKG